MILKNAHFLTPMEKEIKYEGMAQFIPLQKNGKEKPPAGKFK